MTNTKKRINRHREMVIEAMKENEACRNSDLELLLHVLLSRGVFLTETQKYAIRNSGVEFKTLLRERQFVQSKQLYLPTIPEVLKKRKKLAIEYTEHYGTEK